MTSPLADLAIALLCAMFLLMAVAVSLIKGEGPRIRTNPELSLVWTPDPEETERPIGVSLRIGDERQNIPAEDYNQMLPVQIGGHSVAVYVGGEFKQGLVLLFADELEALADAEIGLYRNGGFGQISTTVILTKGVRGKPVRREVVLTGTVTWLSPSRDL